MAKKITKSQLETLEQQRVQVQTELQNLRSELMAEIEFDDVDDVASDLVERDKIQAMILTLERKLNDIDHAIEKAQVVGYGICESCGKTIDPERLEIFPETTLCIDCKRQAERRGRMQQY
ncbi:MAG: TraR/DksA C4-type zinc finger protein [Anaerolineae bacterium]|nr:TraR/DksA C4-type zinc finger protein [Anaerolineae bacterium]